MNLGETNRELFQRIYKLAQNKEALPGGGGSHVARLNFKTSRVGVYKCFTSLSEIERKFFVFVGILEKGDGDALQRNHYSSAISQLTFLISNTKTCLGHSQLSDPRLTDLINREGTVVTL